MIVVYKNLDSLCAHFFSIPLKLILLVFAIDRIAEVWPDFTNMFKFLIGMYFTFDMIGQTFNLILCWKVDFWQVQDL